MRSIEAALVQMCSVGDSARSIARAVELTRSALDAGAELVVLPENHAGIGQGDERLGWAVDPEEPERGAALAPLCELSRCSEAWIIAGGVPERAGDATAYNTAFVVHGGGVVARYRKIHLFAADLDGGWSVREADWTAPGRVPAVVDCPLARIGLSICYDLRFPELYRALADAGAEVLVVPSAFTVPTGRAHWEPLLRARAIENQAYVLAPAQHGVHGPGRESYGHSMIVDPWGVVVAKADDHDSDTVVAATLDPARLDYARRSIDALHHRTASCEPAEVTRFEGVG